MLTLLRDILPSWILDNHYIVQLNRRFGASAKSELGRYFLKGFSASLILRLLSIALSFATSVILARLLNLSDYGTYVYAVSWLNLLAVFALLGFDNVLIRDVSIYASQKQWHLLRGLLHRGNQIGFIGSVVLFGLLLGTFPLWRGELTQQDYLTLAIMLTALPLVALSKLREAALRGLRKVVAGEIPEIIILPITFLLLVGSLFLFGQVNLINVTIGRVVTYALAFGTGSFLLVRSLTPEVRQSKPHFVTRTWMSSGLILMLAQGMKLIYQRTPIVLLGSLQGSDAVALFNAANRYTEMAALVLMLFNLVLSPVVASLYASGDIQRLQRIVKLIIFVSVLLSSPIIFGLLVYGSELLAVFGDEFVMAKNALSILTFGQIMNVLTGPAGVLLMMTGHERDTSVIIGVGAFTNIALNLIMIPLYGVNGAAIATAASLTIWNSLLAIQAYRTTHIDGTIVSLFH